MGIEPHAYNIWKQCYLDVTLYIYIYCIYTVYLTKISILQEQYNEQSEKLKQMMKKLSLVTTVSIKGNMCFGTEILVME